MDKATPTLSPATVDSVMALYREVVEALLYNSDAVADAETEFLAEVERLAAQAAPSSAIIASLCGDVEPVAWGIFANNGNIRFWACDKASADSQAAKTGGDVEGIFRASTVAALKAERDALRARVAELEKDTARLEFVCNSPNRMVERESGLWRVYEDVAPTDHPTAVWQGMTPRWHVTPREAIDAAITAALTKGQP